MSLAVLGRPARAVFWVASRPFAWVARAKGWRWFALVMAECLVAVVGGAVLWVAVGRMMFGLPDVGDPFDVAAFKAERVAPGDNAWVLFDRAMKAYERPPSKIESAWRMGRTYAPAKPDDPEVGKWLDANRKALALYLEGCDRPDAMPTRYVEPDGRPFRVSQSFWAQGDLARLALEEGARRQARGDTEGAWACYRAVLRQARLIGRRADVSDRSVAGHVRGMALGRVQVWADDPQTTPALLRRALDDVHALEALDPDDGYTVKALYVNAMLGLSGPSSLWGRFDPSLFAGPSDRLAPVIVNFALHPLRRLHANEPERARRVVRLLAADWLDYFATPPDRRPAPAVRVVIRYRFGAFATDIFPFGPDAPPAARAVDPQELAEALAASPDARSTLGGWNMLKTIRNKEQSDHAGVLYTLAEALYRRDHNGAPPPSAAALVGRYLKSPLPDDPIPLADDPTPIIDVGP
jgi:hypothetical protein